MSQSVRTLHEKFPIKETYQMTQGDKGLWGVFGYQVPKTYDYTYHDIEHQFPKEKRTDAMMLAEKRSKEPDPSKYAPETISKKSWKGPNALFSKSKKFSIIDEAMKLSARVPGPGKYIEEPKDLKKTATMGKFDKSPKINFLSTVEALSGENPCSWKYSPYDNVDRKRSNWSKTAKPGPRKKETLGPGYYKEVEKAIEKQTLVANPKFSIPRAKSARSIANLQVVKGIPGVGTYANSDLIESMAYKVKKSSRRVIQPYKSKRYMDEVTRLAAAVPGPGAYHIGPKQKKRQKYAIDV